LDDRKAFKEMGISGYFTKPFHHAELLDAIGKALHLEYQYGDKFSASQQRPDNEQLPSKMNTLLPENLRQGIMRAALADEDAILMQLLGDVELYDKDLACQMQTFVRNHQKDQLFSLLSCNASNSKQM
jgi:hypothetical protein